MTGLRKLIAPLFICFAFSAVAWAAPPLQAPPAPSAKDKCPVCGMFVAKYPDWVASSRFRDGTIFYFDGPKDMFSHFFDAPRYTSGRRQADIVAMVVKEYYSLQMLDARNAYFVIGSDVYGPMGNELIPFASQKDAAAFMADHKGKKIVRFNEITKQMVKSLN